MLAGDFNAHSQRWDLRCTERRDAAYWEDIIDEHGLVIGNDDRPTHHWTRNESEGESIIDLTLANRPVGKWMILDGSHVTGSDHKIIEWEVDMEKQEEAEGTQVVGWNQAAMLQEDEKQAKNVWIATAKGRVYFGEESTGDIVESEAEWCQEVLNKVLNATAKTIRICAHSKRWWNG
jgi:hypothetical protein